MSDIQFPARVYSPTRYSALLRYSPPPQYGAHDEENPDEHELEELRPLGPFGIYNEPPPEPEAMQQRRERMSWREEDREWYRDLRRDTVKAFLFMTIMGGAVAFTFLIATGKLKFR